MEAVPPPWPSGAAGEGSGEGAARRGRDEDAPLLRADEPLSLDPRADSPRASGRSRAEPASLLASGARPAPGDTSGRRGRWAAAALAAVVLLVAVPWAFTRLRPRPAFPSVRYAAEPGVSDPDGSSSPATTSSSPSGTASVPRPFPEGVFGVTIHGDGGLAVAAAAAARVGAQGAGPQGILPRLAFATSAGGRVATAGDDGSALHVGLEPAGVRLLAHAVPLREDVNDPGASPPLGMPADLLRGALLPCAPGARGGLVAALALLASGDATGASDLAAAVEPRGSLGAALLLAACALERGDLAGVHHHAAVAAAEPTTAAAAMTLRGAALLLDDNPAEARRDLSAAIERSPERTAPRLLAALAAQRLGLEGEATRGYTDVVRRGGPAWAALGLAALEARGDRAAAIAALERFTLEHGDLGAGWRLLGDLHRGGTPSASDLAAAVRAYGRYAEASPKSAIAWESLGLAHVALASAAEEGRPWRAAAQAFERQTRLDPTSGPAWFNRGSAMHQAATHEALGPDVAAFRERMREARTCYGEALRRGLAPAERARAYFNLGLLLEYDVGSAVAASATGPDSGADPLPATPRAAFEAAVRADPTYRPAAVARVAAELAEGDRPAAERELRALPADTDAYERNVLEASVRWAAGDARGTRLLLARSLDPAAAAAPPPSDAIDPLPPLARALVELGYRRTAFALLSREAADPARIAMRARVRALLRDPDGLTADLALLARVDPPRAERVRRDDLAVRAALGS